MRKLITACGLVAGAFVVIAQAPSVRVDAQEPSEGARPASRASGAANRPAALPRSIRLKKRDIRQLMDLTGAKDLGQQLMSAGIAQFRSSVTESQPDNPRANQFADAFALRFRKTLRPPQPHRNSNPHLRQAPFQ